ncbi:MAG: hypothetical protein ABIT10_00555 [Alteraurantiacibacter sp.]
MTRARRLLALGMIALASACTTPLPPTQTPAPAWTSASFTMNSWGHPLTAWTVEADGSGTWSESTPRNGQFNDRVTTTHALPADPQAAATLAASLSRLPGAAPDDTHCKNRVTDQVYGELTLSFGERVKQYRYNAGCLDAAYVRYVEQLRAVDELVAARGRAAADLP